MASSSAAFASPDRWLDVPHGADGFFDHVESEEQAYLLGALYRSTRIYTKEHQSTSARADPPPKGVLVAVESWRKALLEQLCSALGLKSSCKLYPYVDLAGEGTEQGEGIFLRSRRLARRLQYLGVANRYCDIPLYRHPALLRSPRHLRRHLLRGSIDGRCKFELHHKLQDDQKSCAPAVRVIGDKDLVYGLMAHLREHFEEAALEASPLLLSFGSLIIASHVNEVLSHLYADISIASPGHLTIVDALSTWFSPSAGSSTLGNGLPRDERQPY